MSMGTYKVKYGGVSYLKMFLNADQVMYDSKRSLQDEQQVVDERQVVAQRQTVLV